MKLRQSLFNPPETRKIKFIFWAVFITILILNKYLFADDLVMKTGFEGAAFAEPVKDYWCYIRTYDRPEVNIGETGGRSKKGDIVEIRSATYTPSSKELSEWAVVRVSGLSKTEIGEYRKQWLDNNGNTLSYRMYKVDIASLNITKAGFSGIVTKTTLQNQTTVKTSADIKRYKNQAIMYAMAKPLRSMANWIERLAFAAENVSTINKTGEDYNTLTLWEDAKDGDITAGNSEVAECYDDDGDLDDTVTISGWTTDSDSKCIIRAATGEQHDGTHLTGFTLAQSTTGTGSTITINQAGNIYCDISGLVIKKNPAGNGSNIFITAVPATNLINISYNVFYSTGATTTGGIYCDEADSVWNIYNNVFIGCQRDFFGGIRANLGTGNAYNNSFYNCNLGIRADSAGLLAKNNAVLDTGSRGCFYNTGNFSASSANNLSTDATGDDFGSGGIANATITAGVDVVSLTANSEDLHLFAASGDLWGTGVNVYSDATLAITSDIDNDTLTVRDDIGADEFVTAGGANPDIESWMFIVD